MSLYAGCSLWLTSFMRSIGEFDLNRLPFPEFMLIILSVIRSQMWLNNIGLHWIIKCSQYFAVHQWTLHDLMVSTLA